MRPESRGLAFARLVARGPRLAVFGAAGLLSIGGVRAAIAPPAATSVPTSRAVVAPAAVVPFAEAFVRDYLTWDARDPADRERRLAAYLAEGVDPDGGLAPAPGASQRPEWTVAAAAVRAAELGRGWRVAVLAALPGGRRITLLVPIATGAGGSLAVSDYPSLTALAARSGARAVEWRDPVEDAELERVLERAMRNYLAGRATDLAADLAPGARVTTPETRGRLDAIEELVWQQPGRRVALLAAVLLEDGSRARLRVHLDVRRDGRWFVASINTPTPSPQGDTR